MEREEAPVPASATGTAVGDQILAVGALYAELGEAIEAFRFKSGVECPPDCGGRCCEGFEPDILEPEALYLAAWIRLKAPELERRLEEGREGRGCPFWDVSSGKCSCYPGRALVCRAFGFGAVRSSSGELAYRLCFAMPELRGRDGRQRRSWSGEELLDALGAEPPLMADWGTRLLGIDPSSARGPLGAQVKRALARLALLDRFSPSPDNDNPSVPPRAA